MRANTWSARVAAAAVVLAMLSACGGEDSSSTPGATQKPPEPAPVPANNKPTISGNPAENVTAGSAYVFQPGASDADGDALKFQAANVPGWATFDPATGRLAGTPQAADVGTYFNVAISVSDGKATTALPAFSITVAQVQLGSATLSWEAPTENTDGTPLADLAGYRIRWGRDPSELDQVQGIPNPGITTAVVEGLAAGTWYFTVSAYNRDGLESEPSDIALKTVM